MGFITKNANIILLFLILLSSVALVLSTVFFQSNFDSINEEYQTKMMELDKASQELNTTVRILENYRDELEMKDSREKEISEQYTVVQTEKEKVATQKEKLEQQKQSLESELTSTETQLSKAKNDLAAKISLVDSLKADLAECEDDRDTYQSALNNAENNLDACQDDLAECQSNCTS